jgi:hypothetical protein
MSANGKLRRVFLVHGEEKQALTLQSILKGKGVRQVEYPNMYDSVEL